MVFPSTMEKGGKNIYVESEDGVEFYSPAGKHSSSLNFPHDGYFVDAGGYLALSQGGRCCLFDKNGKMRLDGSRADVRVFLQQEPLGFHLEGGKAKSKLKAGQKQEVNLFRGNSILSGYDKFHFLPWGEFLLVDYGRNSRGKNRATVCDRDLKVMAEIDFNPKEGQRYQDYGHFEEIAVDVDLGFFDSFVDEEGTLIVLGEKGIAIVPLGEEAFHLSVERDARVVGFSSGRGKFILRVPGDKERILF